MLFPAELNINITKSTFNYCKLLFYWSSFGDYHVRLPLNLIKRALMLCLAQGNDPARLHMGLQTPATEYSQPDGKAFLRKLPSLLRWFPERELLSLWRGTRKSSRFDPTRT